MYGQSRDDEPVAGARGSDLKGFGLALTATVLLSFNYVTSKYAMRGFHWATFTVLWLAASAIFGLLLLAATGKLREVLLPRQLMLPVLLVSLLTAGSMLMGWSGIDRLESMTYASFLLRFMPLLTILLGVVVLGERWPPRILAPASLMILGSLYSAWGDWEAVGAGTLLLLGATFFRALLFLVAKKTVHALSPEALTFWRSLLALPMVALFTFGTGRADFSAAPRY